MGQISIDCAAGTGEPGCAPFYNAIALMKHLMTTNQGFSYILSSSTESLSAGDTINITVTILVCLLNILTQDVNVYDTTFILGGDTITYVTYKDTITLPDFIQTYFMTQWDNSVYNKRCI